MNGIRAHATCDALGSKIEDVWNEGQRQDDRQQEAFHEAEARTSRILRKPLETEIESNKQQIRLLLDTIESVSVEIHEGSQAIDGMDALMQPLSDRMDAIRGRFPDMSLPSDVFDEFEDLRKQWNSLNDARNDLIAELNLRVEVHNETNQTRNSLIDTTNLLTDALSRLP